TEFHLIEADEFLTREAGLRREHGRHPTALASETELLDRAAARHAVARGYLMRVPGELLAGRRNVVWWKFFLQLVAQYQSEKNLWALATVIGRAARYGGAAQLGAHEVAGFLRRLRRGLRAVRRGLDRDLDPASFDPWLQQIWRELFLCSMLFGRLAEGIAK